MRNSLHFRLLAGTLASVTVIWIVLALFAWREARHEAEELFDAHLAQTAVLLAAFAGHDADEIDEHVASHPYTRKVAFQIWQGEQLLVHSDAAPQTRLSPVERGFSDAAGWRVYSLWDDRGRHLIQVAEALQARHDVSRQLAEHLLTPLAIALPLLALALALLIRRSLRPLSQLADDIGHRDAGRLDPIAAAGAPSELKPVLDRLNQLFARVDASLTQERRFTADAAHELRTPLAAMRTHAQVAMGAVGAASPAERDSALASVIEATDRATHLIEQLLTLARLDATAINSAFTDCDLHDLAATAIAAAAPTAMAKGVELVLTDGPAVSVRGDAALLGVLLRNLIDNAVRYSPSNPGVTGGNPLCGTGVTATVRSDGRPLIEIVDQGPGIPPAERARVLGRFYRIAGSGASGSGLGLSIAARIAELHGARIEFDDGPGGKRGKGLTVRVVF